MGRRIDQGEEVDWSYIALVRLQSRRFFLLSVSRDLQDWERLLFHRIHLRMRAKMLFATMKVNGQLN